MRARLPPLRVILPADPRNVSSPIVVEACLRVLGDPPTTGGAYAPAQLFDAGSFLGALAPWLTVL